jgi:hypothetical protein
VRDRVAQRPDPDRRSETKAEDEREHRGSEVAPRARPGAEDCRRCAIYRAGPGGWGRARDLFAGAGYGGKITDAITRVK